MQNSGPSPDARAAAFWLQNANLDNKGKSLVLASTDRALGAVDGSRHAPTLRFCLYVCEGRCPVGRGRRVRRRR